MGFTSSENLNLKIQDDEEFISIVPTAENFQKIDKAYGDLKNDVEEKATKATEDIQAVSTALSGKAAAEHGHTAAEITETTEKKVLTAAERTKLSGIATGATKNIVDGALNANSTNAVENGVIYTALSGKASAEHGHTAEEITETTEKKVLTAAERTKLSGIATGATKNIVDGEINKDSNNAVSNAAVSAKLSDLTMNDLSMIVYIAKIAEHLSAQGGFSDASNGSSGYLFIGEVLIQWGFTPHSNAAAEKIEQVAITFDSNLKYKTAQYLVFTNTEATNPSIVWATPSDRTVSGFKLNYFCKSTAKSNIYWLTIGRGTRNATEDALPSDS